MTRPARGQVVDSRNGPVAAGWVNGRMADRMDPTAEGYAGYKDYTPSFLRIYDWWVLGFMARAVWRTPVGPMVDAYSRLAGHRHLEVGPGTGYLLTEAALPDGIEITLVDPNPHVLAHASGRLAGHAVVPVQASVLEPLLVDGPLDSAALSNVLHCLPGPIEAKGRAIRYVAKMLHGDGVLFGSTVLGLPESHTRAARTVIRAANRQGGFDNLGDTVDGLRAILEESFSSVEIDVAGSIGLFEARRPRSWAC